MTSASDKRRRLRQIMTRGRISVAPCAHDVFTARLIEQAEFEVVGMGGFATAATLTAQPDIGLLSMSEMAEQAHRLALAVDVPVMADGDTGYGNVWNVWRTVHEFEDAGVASIMLEDQVNPKRCGHMAGKTVVPKEEMVEKIHAAVEARRDPDFVIVGRTDARSVNGLADAIERAAAYRDAGADAIFVTGPQSVDEMREIIGAVKAPHKVTWPDRSHTKVPHLTADELEKIGYAMVSYSVTLTLLVGKQVVDALEQIKREGTTRGVYDKLMTFDEVNRRLGLPFFEVMERKLAKQ